MRVKKYYEKDWSGASKIGGRGLLGMTTGIQVSRGNVDHEEEGLLR
jgi:hypothetical protein